MGSAHHRHEMIGRGSDLRAGRYLSAARPVDAQSIIQIPLSKSCRSPEARARARLVAQLRGPYVEYVMAVKSGVAGPVTVDDPRARASEHPLFAQAAPMVFVFLWSTGFSYFILITNR